jgi:hypothetical protein
VKDRIAKLCVGLAAPADPPEQEAPVDTLMRAHTNPLSLVPWAGIVTHDLQWIGGFSGRIELDAIVGVLDAAEKSPLLDATPEVAKKLDAVANDAEQQAAKAQWQRVMSAAKSAAQLNGRCAARERIAAAVGKARAWAEKELTDALVLVRGNGDRAIARAALKKVAGTLPGEPEAAEADAGVRALDKIAVLETLPADKLDAARDRAHTEFAATRWKVLFEKPREPQWK